MSSSESPQVPQRLPPGMVIGPDGKPCKICTAFRNWKVPKTNADASSKPKSKDTSSNASFAAIAGTMSTLATGPVTKEPIRPSEPPEGCPPDVEQLGRATWTFLHTTAAYYPEQPSPAQRTRMLGLLLSLPVLYPCSWCAKHFGEEIQRSPPDVSNREGLSKWLCEQHNRVNKRLGKPSFDCSIKSTDERWKDGPNDGRCD